MGMFDEVRCTLKMPDGFQADVTNLYQTKDMDCQLDIYEIDGKGQLCLVKDFNAQYRDEPRKLGPIDWTGELAIYTADADGKWHEYEIVFYKGRIQSIGAYGVINWHFREGHEDLMERLDADSVIGWDEDPDQPKPKLLES